MQTTLATARGDDAPEAQLPYASKVGNMSTFTFQISRLIV
jgi:hypothetical protein